MFRKIHQLFKDWAFSLLKPDRALNIPTAGEGEEEPNKPMNPETESPAAPLAITYTQSQLDAAISRAVEAQAKVLRATTDKRIEEALAAYQAQEKPIQEQELYIRGFKELEEQRMTLEREGRILDLKMKLIADGLPVEMAELLENEDPSYAQLLLARIKKTMPEKRK